ncbi:unnamed protein product [Trichogramma brassicae]|uniref:Uncharacterized protein n=1 Tax=Trichogramma brassicae TaxID=86971 RepID=A0A6H5I8M4_9HYME|nr:unnamed protein product [Trichogramma brassicae]
MKFDRRGFLQGSGISQRHGGHYQRRCKLKHQQRVTIRQRRVSASLLLQHHHRDAVRHRSHPRGQAGLRKKTYFNRRKRTSTNLSLQQYDADYCIDDSQSQDLTLRSHYTPRRGHLSELRADNKRASEPDSLKRANVSAAHNSNGGIVMSFSGATLDFEHARRTNMFLVVSIERKYMHAPYPTLLASQNPCSYTLPFLEDPRHPPRALRQLVYAYLFELDVQDSKLRCYMEQLDHMLLLQLSLTTLHTPATQVSQATTPSPAATTPSPSLTQTSHNEAPYTQAAFTNPAYRSRALPNEVAVQLDEAITSSNAQQAIAKADRLHEHLKPLGYTQIASISSEISAPFSEEDLITRISEKTLCSSNRQSSDGYPFLSSRRSSPQKLCTIRIIQHCMA